VLSRIDDDFLAHVNAISEYMRTKLSAMEDAADVTGKGMMIGVRPKNKTPGEVLKACQAKGLLILTAHDRIRLLPPLVLTKEEADEGLEILQACL
jgi:acetylornithine/N-succinyldiaminopimelate aminotransferase